MPTPSKSASTATLKSQLSNPKLYLPLIIGFFCMLYYIFSGGMYRDEVKQKLTGDSNIRSIDSRARSQVITCTSGKTFEVYQTDESSSLITNLCQ